MIISRPIQNCRRLFSIGVPAPFSYCSVCLLNLHTSPTSQSVPCLQCLFTTTCACLNTMERMTRLTWFTSQLSSASPRSSTSLSCSARTGCSAQLSSHRAWFTSCIGHKYCWQQLTRTRPGHCLQSDACSKSLSTLPSPTKWNCCKNRTSWGRTVIKSHLDTG